MGERMEYQRVINEITNNCEKVIKNEKLLNMKTEYLQKQLQTIKVKYGQLDKDKNMIEQTLKRTL